MGILISGRGSNLQAIIDAVHSGTLAADVAVVISNRREAPGLGRARAAGIEALYLNPREHSDRDSYDRAIAHALQARGVSLVCLAGFMRLVGPPLLEAFPGRILNIHPSLLPSFPGLDAQQQALEHGVKVSGATVHIVNAELDAGPIVMQAAVPILTGDTVESLAARILIEEHRIYPLAIAQMLGQPAVGSQQATVDSLQRPVDYGQPFVGDAEAALVRAVPFASDAAFTVVQLHGREDALTKRLRDVFPRATVKTFGEDFDVSSLKWWDAMFGADLVVAAFVMPKLTDAKKQYLYKAAADRLSSRGGLLVAEAMGTSGNQLLHHMIWLRHAGFTEVDCRWVVDDVAVFGGFKPHAAAASAPPLRVDS